MSEGAIPGYRFGDAGLPPAPMTPTAFEQLQQCLLLGDEDRAALREAAAVVGPRIEEVLDVWYGFVGGHDVLLASFSTAAGPDAEYLARVRARFGQWVRDTLRADFDDAWLRYQFEIGRRHAAGKNATDGVKGAPDVVPFRYLVALIYPIFATMRPFLAAEAKDEAQLERMHHAWLKVVVLSVALWAQPYVIDGWY